MEVQEEKTGEERGRYVHPGPYGEPEGRGIHRRAIPAEVGRMEEEGRQLPQPPQPLGTDLAHLEKEGMRGLAQQQPTQTLSPPDIDFARLEEEHRRRTADVRRDIEEVQRRMEGGKRPPEPT
jgi:sirohydrochlorin ferrochelatase